jgi:adenine phosphoribosyltransferase
MEYLPLIDRSRTLYKRSDVTPIFAEPAAFAALVEDLVRPFGEQRVQLVAGLDALGFIIGTGMALKMGAGFLPIRKGGKLPVLHDRETAVDYQGKEKILELRLKPFAVGARVLLADDWIETGAQARAAIALIERAGGVVAGIAAVGFRKNERTAGLWAKYRCHGVWPEQV